MFRSSSWLALLLVSTSALSAQAASRELLTQAGEPGTVALDQLAGFRVSSLSGASGFVGPVSFTYQRIGLEGGASTQSTTLAFAPSADVFVVEQLSLGALAEVSYQSVSTESAAGGISSHTSGSGFGLSLVPRIGYLLRVGDRFAIWPKVGVGYVRQSFEDSSYQGLQLEADVGFVYRANEMLYLKMGPQVAWSPVGSSEGIGVSTLRVGGGMALGMFWEP